MSALVVITSGFGPIEVRRFVALLADRIEERASVNELTVRARKIQGPCDAPRSVILSIEGDVWAVLGAERGTHALIERRVNARKSRKRWFASVEFVAMSTAAMPRPEKFVVQTCCARGPGGQNVNRRHTAVRVIDCHSGIIVRADDQRSQLRNRSAAFARLQAALMDRRASNDVAHQQYVRRLCYRVARGAAVRVYEIDRRGRLLENSHAGS